MCYSAEEAIEAREDDFMVPPPQQPRRAAQQMRYNRKIAIMGYPCVGKSSITLRFINGQFPAFYDTTIEDRHDRDYSWNGREYSLRITDTAGQQGYAPFPKSCAVNVDGFILVYAIDERESFNTIKKVHDDIAVCFGEGVPVVLVGNKLDLQYAHREVSREEGEALAREWNAPFVEISARNLDNVQNHTLIPAVMPLDNAVPNEVKEIFEKTILAIEVAMGNMTPDDWPPSKRKRCSVM